MTSKYNAHFIPNTHLDREWTMDSQRTRRMTVQFLDDLLEIMEEIPDYRFLLDSQAVPLEDYFEIRPENEEKYRQLIQDGRVDAGPWYTALDMNCVNGESIVRNLLWGHLVVEQYGPVMKVGYTPFGWGQISQLPQIYKGFGIDMAYFYRGITAEQAPKSEFLWVSPDGTELLTSRFGSRARYNFYFGVWRPSLYDGLEDRLHRRFNWNQDGAPFKLCNEQNRFEHGYVHRLNREVDPAILRDRFRELLDIEKEQFGTAELAFMHGMDTSAPDRREKDIMDAMQQYLHEDEAFFFSSLPRYSAAVQEQVRGKLDMLPRVIGEARHLSFNDYGFSYIANDIISARTRQKALMAQVESNLSRSAEPFAVMSYMLGNEWPEKYFEIAWKQFMKCQPHDTIGGCGIDTIEEDVMARLRDTNYIANLISSESLLEVQLKVDTSSLGQDAIILTTYNPCVYPRTAVVDAYVDIPRELGITAFVVEDSDGHEVPFAAESTQHYGKVFRDHTDLALNASVDEFHIKFEAADVPAMGYKTFVLKKGEAAELPTIAANDTTLESEFIKAVVNSNGTVTITNKETGEIYEQMNYFQDIGEVGHAWSHVHGIDDRGITTQGVTAENEVIENSAVQGTIKSTIVFAVPATTPSLEDRVGTDWRQITRDYTSDLVDLTITSEYSLKKGSKTLDVTVAFDNQCTNHRLRAMFPTHVHAEKSYAEAPFDVHERYIEPSEINPYARFPYLTFPFIRFFGVKDATRNVTIIAHGLKEYEALNDGNRTLALTLMRGYENVICTTDEWEYRPGDLSQSIGKHEFTYSIYTGTVIDSYANLYREADGVSTPIIASETKAEEGELPLIHSFVSLDNDLFILSGIKKEARGNRVVIRVHNASNTTQEANLEFGQDVKAAFYSNLNEELAAEVVVMDSRKVIFRADAKKIVTLVIEL